MDSCIFCKIGKHEAEAAIVYEDAEVVVFKDIHPQAPVHVLVIPKKHIEDFYQLAESNLFSPIHQAIVKLIDENGLMSKGYKIEVNGGGAQIVPHLHFHLLGPIVKLQPTI